MRVSSAAFPLLTGAVVLCSSAVSGNFFTGCIAGIVCIISVLAMFASRKYEQPVYPPVICAVACLLVLLPLSDLSVWNGGYGGSLLWDHVEGAGLWAVIFPASYMAIAVVASVCDGRYNRYLAYGFSSLMSMGVMVAVWVLVSVFHTGDLDILFTYSQEGASLLMCGLLSFATACIAVHHLNGSGMALERREVERR